uniref:C6 domain-containing protein n=1 Tax=Panagrolaimus sp. ES5 TaxID=591445 RepID=A0AC34GND0_9BILA
MSLHVLFCVLIISFLPICNGCFGSANGGTPEIVINPCTTCTLPILPPPEGGDIVEAPGTQTISTVGPGCLVFDVTCTGDDGETVAFGGTRNGMNIVVTTGMGALMAQFICNQEGIVQGPNSDGDTVEFDSVYCSQTTNG